MKTTKIAIMALMLLSFASCQKDEAESLDSNKKAVYSSRGSEDEVVISGIVRKVESISEVKIFSMDLDKYLEDVPVQEDGSFTASVPGGPYVFELFENGVFISASEVLVIDKENTHVELSF